MAKRRTAREAHDGGVVRGTVEGTDTYGTTAVIAVECTRRLVDGQARSGALAASQAFEPGEFLDRLAAYNIRSRIEGGRYSGAFP